MKLYIARHGKTNFNELGLCNADPAVDVHLTATGISQAEALCQKLAQRPIGRIYISELRRTKQTAEIINAKHHAPITVDPRLNDISTGYENKHFSEYFAALDQAPDRWSAQLNEGESFHDLMERLRRFVADLQRQSHESALVVTSLVVVQGLRGIVLNLSVPETFNFEVEQGGYLEFDL